MILLKYFLLGFKGSLNQTIIGDKGGKQILIAEVPKIEIENNPFINRIVPSEENIDSEAEHLDDFKLRQDPSVMLGEYLILKIYNL